MALASGNPVSTAMYWKLSASGAIRVGSSPTEVNLFPARMGAFVCTVCVLDMSADGAKRQKVHTISPTGPEAKSNFSPMGGSNPQPSDEVYRWDAYKSLTLYRLS